MSKSVVVIGGTLSIGGTVSHVLSFAGWQVITACHAQEKIDAFEITESIEPKLLDVTDAAPAF